MAHKFRDVVVMDPDTFRGSIRKLIVGGLALFFGYRMIM